MHTENPCLPTSVRRRNHRRYSLYRNLSGTALYQKRIHPLLLVQRQPGRSAVPSGKRGPAYCCGLPPDPTSKNPEPYQIPGRNKYKRRNVPAVSGGLQGKRKLPYCTGVCGVLCVIRQKGLSDDSPFLFANYKLYYYNCLFLIYFPIITHL